ncbi:DUF4136 domain-containing protein [Nibrella viscosa]
MKLLTLFTAVLISVSMAGCANRGQNVIVNADQRLNHDFSNYKSFTWASQVDNQLDPGFYFLNDLVLKERIRNAVAFSLEGRGYNKVQQNADLIVNFRVFDKPTTIQGFTGYGSGYWGDLQVRNPENSKEFQVEAGTLIINLLDKNTGEVVWQGFASGLMDGNVFDKREDKIKQAVNLIFEKYPYRGDKLGS